MPRTAQIQNNFTFVKGLFTDGGPVLPLPDTAHVLKNVELNVDGGVTKRKGLKHVPFTTSFNTIEHERALTDSAWDSGNCAVSRGTWYLDKDITPETSGETTNQIEVVQIGYYIYFLYKPVTYQANGPLTPIDLVQQTIINSDGTPEVLDLKLGLIRGGIPWVNLVEQEPVQFTSNNGRLFITNKYIEPLMVELQEDLSGQSNVVAHKLQLFQRDTEGLHEENSAARYATLSYPRQYNLINNGWASSGTASYGAYFTALSVYPSLEERYYDGFYPNVTTGVRAWSAQQTQDYAGGLAPKGHLYIDPLSKALGITQGNATEIKSITVGGTGVMTITTVEPHNLTSGTALGFIQGSKWLHSTSGLEVSLDGYYVLGYASATTLTIVIGTVVIWDTGTYTEIKDNRGFLWHDSGLNIAINRLELPAVGTPQHEPEGYSAVNTYASRVWYAGAGVNQGTLYFSQILTDNRTHLKCYSVEDPTAEQTAGILATDGGTIHIAGLGEVLAMRSLGSSQLIFTTTGVWQMQGLDNQIFTPSGYTVSRISKTAIIAPAAIVETGTTVYFWSKDGINRIASQLNNDRTYNVETISRKRIDSYLEEIPTDKEKYILGDYDDTDYKVYWLMNKDGNAANAAKKEILVYDEVLDAFYELELPVLTGMTAGLYNTYIPAMVIPKGKPATGNVTDKILFTYIRSEDDTVTRDRMSLLSFSDETTWLDDLSIPTENTDTFTYNCEVLTGYDVVDNPTFYKQLPYIWAMLGNTRSNYSVKMQGRWNWETAGEGKWSSMYEIHRPTSFATSNNEIIVSKNKLRGRGRALQLYFKGTEGKAFELYGWAGLFEIQQGA